jgi:hypothetical protein
MENFIARICLHILRPFDLVKFGSLMNEVDAEILLH